MSEAHSPSSPGGTAGGLAVCALEPALEAAWESFAAAHPAAGIYHSLAWRDVTAEGLGHAPHYLCARDAAGAVRGILPLFLVTGPFGRRLVSMPMRDRGGIAANDAAAAAALVEAAARLRGELGCRYLELRGLEELGPEVLGARDWRFGRSWVTHRLDLTPGAEVLWSRLNRKALRWSIKKARKHGLRVEADDSLAGMLTFHRLFVRTRCTMGIPPFPESLFSALHRHLIASGRAQLLLVWNGEEPVHGLFSLLSGDSFIPAYAAPQNEHRKLFGNELVFWHSIEYAAEHGFRTYDFGADSKLQEGLHAFKRKWGAESHPMTYHFLFDGPGEPPDFDSSGRRFELVRAVWRRLPMAVAQPLGGWLTRQLS